MPLDRAAFVISIDTEMAWGLSHRPQERYSYPAERADLASLLALFDRYDIPATWAVVGHLMLERCEPVDGVRHPEIIRPEYPWLEGDWFDADPCSDVDRANDRYAPDLVRLILGAEARHEIASHGFSHMMAGEDGCSRHAFESELQAAVAAASDLGLTLRSIVYPRNSIGHVDALRDRGFIAYRGRPERLPATPWQRIVDRVVGSERTAVRPSAEDGLWNLPSSVLYNIDAHHGRTRAIWLRQIERRLDQAVRRASLFHLWFHPHNLRADPQAALAGLERLCRAAALHRDRGRLDTVTMGELAGRLSDVAAG
ncbi:MAG: polysaccharide deacetylase family protein [Acidimicrobiales bacterium]